MDLQKHEAFFSPLSVSETIHIIGLGAVGSNVANHLARLGFDNVVLWDFDTVDEHNITNQVYGIADIGKPKIEAIKAHMLEINPEMKIYLQPKGWEPGAFLGGLVFLCLDSIELRRKIMQENEFNDRIQFMTDIRIGLEQGQMRAALWADRQDKINIISSTDFKDSEVAVPRSACGTQLTVLPTIQMIVSLGVMNMIRFIKEGIYNYISTIDSIRGVAVSQEKR